MKKKNLILSMCILAVMAALIVVLLIDLAPIMEQVLQNNKNESNLESYIDAYGAKGAPILIGLCILQVISTVIPAAAIQMLGGLCYGIWRGALVSVAGYAIGNAIVFAGYRQVRKGIEPLFKDVFADKKEKTTHKFISVATIQGMKRPELLAFFLVLIPGLPNGVLPYIFARTKITFAKYILAITLASIPSVVLCTWLGERVSKGDYTTVAILVAVLAVIIVTVLIFRKKIMARIERSGNIG